MVRSCLGTLPAAALLLMVSSAGAQSVTPSSERLTPTTPIKTALLTRAWSERAEYRQGPCLTSFAAVRNSAARERQKPEPQKRNWIGRHPVLFGSMVGLGGGFLIGYLPGDDGVFDDFTAEFNGLVLGGAGAGIGAMVGAFAK